MSFHSDYKDYFFNKSDISTMLSDVGFPIDLGKPKEEAALSADDDTNTPDWMRRWAAKGGLRVHEAAFIFERKEPRGEYPTRIPSSHDEAGKRLRDDINYFIDLYKTGDIRCLSTSQHIDREPNTWLLDQQSIDEWAARTGIDWPLSKFRDQASDASASNNSVGSVSSEQDQETISELKQRIHEKDQEIARLKEERISNVELDDTEAVALKAQMVELEQRVREYEYWLDEGKSPLPAFGLFIDAYVPDVPANQYAENLNVASVLRTLQKKIPSYTQGMSDRTLREIIKASLKSWNNKKEENRPQNR